MLGGGARPLLSRSPSFRPDAIGHNALHLIGNLCFALFVLGVLTFTILAATYQPDDPLLHSSSSRLTSFLSSSSNATFRSDLDSAARTGEDFLQPNATSEEPPVITISNITTMMASDDQDLSTTTTTTTTTAANTAVEQTAEQVCAGAIDCRDPEVYHMMMRATIEHFPDLHFYRFGKPVAVPGSDSTCDMAWRFRPKDAKRASFYKDYRRFTIARSENCSVSITTIGDYHSGVLARKRRKEHRKPANSAADQELKAEPLGVPEVGDVVNDTLPVVESESAFSRGKYLIYTTAGDRCKSMNHYLWSFLCSLGEAQYLNRTLVMDLSICLSSIYSSFNQDEEGKDFRFYFDFEHLKESASVLDQTQFWTDWNQWQKKDGLQLHLVEDFRVTPMKLAEVADTLIMRKFGTVEPDNYWYRVCEGETESVIQRPWHLLWKSPRLMDIVSAIASRMNWDYDSVHIVRGEKAKNTELWPNLAADTSPDSLLATLREKIDDGRHLYIATNEPDTSFFNPLKEKYTTHFLDDFKDMWDEKSKWYAETQKLNKDIPVEFDGYMRVQVDTEVFLRGKKQIETFNDLTNDCKDGINTCRSTA